MDDQTSHMRRASEKVKKRMKMADLKAFVETKLLSKSERTLEKIGRDEPKALYGQVLLNTLYIMSIVLYGHMCTLLRGRHISLSAHSAFYGGRNTLKCEVFDFKAKNVCRGLVHWTQCTQTFEPETKVLYGQVLLITL